MAIITSGWNSRSSATRQSPGARGLTAALIVGQFGAAAQADSAGEFATALRINHGSRRIIRTPKWDKKSRETFCSIPYCRLADFKRPNLAPS